jgi:hypothetical protein
MWLPVSPRAPYEGQLRDGWCEPAIPLPADVISLQYTVVIAAINACVGRPRTPHRHPRPIRHLGLGDPLRRPSRTSWDIAADDAPHWNVQRHVGVLFDDGLWRHAQLDAWRGDSNQWLCLLGPFRDPGAWIHRLILRFGRSPDMTMPSELE